MMEKTNVSLDLHKRKWLTSGLMLIFAWSLFSVHWEKDLFHSGGFTTALQMGDAFFHPVLSKEILFLAISSSWTTLSYAVAGMSLALVLALIIGILASGILAKTPASKYFWVTPFRALLSFMRAIHELVWAWLFVASIGLSPYAAIFALAIPYGGILGKIFADILEDVPAQPIEALWSAGASRIQRVLLGYLPLAAPNMTSYAMYRFECAVRSSAIMSFVGIGGLGYQIQLSLDDLQYNEAWTFIFFLILLVILIDVWSNQLRKRLNQ